MDSNQPVTKTTVSTGYEPERIKTPIVLRTGFQPANTTVKA